MGTVANGLRLAIAVAMVAAIPVSAGATTCKSLGIHFLGDSWVNSDQGGKVVATPVRDYLVETWHLTGNPTYSRVYVEMKEDTYEAYPKGLAFLFDRTDLDGNVILMEKFSLVQRYSFDQKFRGHVQIDLPAVRRLIGPMPDGVTERNELLHLTIKHARETLCTREMKIEMKAP